MCTSTPAPTPNCPKPARMMAMNAPTLATPTVTMVPPPARRGRGKRDGGHIVAVMHAAVPRTDEGQLACTPVGIHHARVDETAAHPRECPAQNCGRITYVHTGSEEVGQHAVFGMGYRWGETKNE